MKPESDVPLTVLTVLGAVRGRGGRERDEETRIVLIYRAIHNMEDAGANNFLSSTRRKFVPILLLHHHLCRLFSFPSGL